VRRGDISKIEDAPDAVAIDLTNSAMRQFGVLYLTVETTQPELTFKLVADVEGGNSSGSIVIDSTPPVSRRGVFGRIWRVDLLPMVSSSGNRSISHLRLLLQASQNFIKRPVQIRLSDALILNAPRRGRGLSTPVPPSEKTLAQGAGKDLPGVMRSLLGTNSVPMVRQSSRGEPLRYRTSIHTEIPSTQIKFTDKTHNHWLIFSEAFDPGWKLLNSEGHSCGVHVRVYGTVNGWYVAKGLNGYYVIAYTPERPAKLGVWMAASGFAACVAWCLASARRKNKGLGDPERSGAPAD